MYAKIFLATHLDTVRPTDPLFKTIHVGAATAKQKMHDVSTDDYFYDNISYKNAHYSELTLMYDIWKNRSENFDIVGLAHYRRTFYNKPVHATKFEYGKLSRPLFDYDETFFNEVFSSEHYEKSFNDLMCGTVDVMTLAPFEKSTKYALFTFADLGWIPAKTVIAFYDFIERTQPNALAKAIEYYTIHEKHHFCNNMLYARTEIFNQYAEWVLTLLFGFEDYLLTLQAKTGNTYILPRMFGYFSEYLMKPFFYYSQYKIGFTNSVCFDGLKTDNRI